ncbi:MAG: transporter [Thermoleophilia bacterium]|nr:transporter [Thermoleophilia bacterium]
MSEPVIQLEGLTKRFGSRTAVDAVSLSVPRGTVYGLVGPNGAGKTTLMRTMLGFTPASGGSATVLGEQMPRARDTIYPRLGVIIEEPRFYPFLTGRENLDQVIAARRGGVAPAAVDAAIERVELTDRIDDRVKAYSLGMRQRLGIARALLHDPELLILDEPSNGLDPAGIRDMRNLLRSFAAEGRTVFVSSHLLGEMEQMCDHVAVLKEGRLVADGQVDLLSGGAGGTALRRIRFGVTDLARARGVLDGSELVQAVHESDVAGCLDVELVAEAPADASATINELLVGAGIRVGRIERASQTLEQRFLEITQ